MDTVCQDNFIRNHLISRSSRADRIAVNIDLRRGIVQSGGIIHTGAGGIFSNCCREHCIVGGDGVSVKCGNIGCTGVNFQISDIRHIAVAYDRAIVKRDIVNKECDFLIEFTIRVDNKFNSRRIHVVSTTLDNIMHIACKIGCRNVRIHVSPTALGNTCLIHAVIRNFLVVHHDLAVYSGPCRSTVRALRPENTGTDINGIFRYVHPHTEAATGISICDIS